MHFAHDHFCLIRLTVGCSHQVVSGLYLNSLPLEMHASHYLALPQVAISPNLATLQQGEGYL